MCLSCGHTHHGTDPVTRRQDVVFEFLQKEFGSVYNLVFDRIQPSSSGCGVRYRADVYISGGVGWRKIIVEVFL